MALDDQALDQIFRTARTHNGWQDKPVSDQQLRDLYDLMKWGPTSANCQPLRIQFLRSEAAKELLKPALGPNNVEKTMKAPVVAILGYDLEFYEHLPKMFPHNQTARSWFAGNDANIQATAFRNSSLQGAYFIIAARSLGLDTGGMSGFDAAKVDAAFWPDGKVKTNFICNLGYGDATKIFSRSPRFGFDEVCKIV